MDKRRRRDDRMTEDDHPWSWKETLVLLAILFLFLAIDAEMIDDIIRSILR
jgi:hypothetical protein